MNDNKNTSWTRREIIQGMGVGAAQVAAQRLAVAQALLPAPKAGRLYTQAPAKVPVPLAANPGTSQPRTSEPAFASAQPVWPKGLEREKNLFVGFRTFFEAPEQHPVLLRATGSTVYRIFVNGAFRGYGPARGPHGYYRVDEWDLTPVLLAGRNSVALEVAGYNVNSYYLIDQPSFLQAEVVAGANVLASTAGRGRMFEAGKINERIQKAQRYSFQRPFQEASPQRMGWLN